MAAPHFEQYLCFWRNKLIIDKLDKFQALLAELKGLAQAKIIKIVILFWLINMSIWPYDVIMSIE